MARFGGSQHPAGWAESSLTRSEPRWANSDGPEYSAPASPVPVGPNQLDPAGPSFLSDSVGPRFFSNLTGPRFPSRPGWAEFHPCDPAGPDSVTRLGRITSTRVGRLSSDPGGPESHHSAGPASCYSAGPGISSDVDHSLPNHPSIHRSIASSPAE